MGCKAGRCKTSTPQGIFIVIPSLEGWPTKAKGAPPPHEVRMSPLDTNPVFQSLGGKYFTCQMKNELKYFTCLKVNMLLKNPALRSFPETNLQVFHICLFHIC